MYTNIVQGAQEENHDVLHLVPEIASLLCITVSFMQVYDKLTAKRATVEAPVSGHPREAEKVSATGADDLRECVNTVEPPQMDTSCRLL